MTINDTFVLISIDKAPKGTINIYKKDHPFYKNFRRAKLKNHPLYVQLYRKWFFDQVNKEETIFYKEIEKLIVLWSKNKRLYFVCDNPKEINHVNVVTEYLSWLIWRKGLMPGYSFKSIVS